MAARTPASTRVPPDRPGGGVGFCLLGLGSRHCAACHRLGQRCAATGPYPLLLLRTDSRLCHTYYMYGAWLLGQPITTRCIEGDSTPTYCLVMSATCVLRWTTDWVRLLSAAIEKPAAIEKTTLGNQNQARQIKSAQAPLWLYATHRSDDEPFHRVGTAHYPDASVRQSQKLEPSQFKVGFNKASNTIPQHWDGTLKPV